MGVFQTAAAELMPTALRLLREEWPGVEVVLTQADDGPRVVDWLAAGRLDSALTINDCSGWWPRAWGTHASGGCPDALLPRRVELCYPRRRHLAGAARALSSTLREQFAH